MKSLSIRLRRKTDMYGDTHWEGSRGVEVCTSSVDDVLVIPRTVKRITATFTVDKPRHDNYFRVKRQSDWSTYWGIQLDDDTAQYAGLWHGNSPWNSEFDALLRKLAGEKKVVYMTISY